MNEAFDRFTFIKLHSTNLLLIIISRSDWDDLNAIKNAYDFIKENNISKDLDTPIEYKVIIDIDKPTNITTLNMTGALIVFENRIKELEITQV